MIMRIAEFAFRASRSQSSGGWSGLGVGFGKRAAHLDSAETVTRAHVVASNVASVLATDLEERLGDLAERAHSGGVHQDGENVFVGHGGFLQSRDG